VESRAAALEYAGRNHGSFDLLLTDVILQDGSGRDLAEAILSIHNHVRVIYMSGYTPNAIVHHGILEEMTMFLQKPFTREALLAKVTACLGG
jgi:DNA-binding NtrC family response regulator